MSINEIQPVYKMCHILDDIKIQNFYFRTRCVCVCVPNPDGGIVKTLVPKYNNKILLFKRMVPDPQSGAPMSNGKK